MKKSKSIFNYFENQMGFMEKSEKYLFRVAFALLIVYMTFVCGAKIIFVEEKLPLPFIIAAGIIPVCVLGVFLCNKITLHVVNRNKKALKFAAFIFVLTFVYYFLWLVAYFPGGFSYDSVIQYAQVVNGQYSDWHPALHTWIIFGIPYMIFHGPEGIIFFQIVLFVLAVTYLFYVLYESGCSKKFIVISYLYLIMNPNTANIMLFPWKDSAFSIFALILFTYLIRIVKTTGGWFGRAGNVFVFSVVAFLANGMRHNAILLIFPIYLILLLFMKQNRRKILLSAILVLFSTILLKGPVFTIAQVEEPGSRQSEILGLPMTVLSDIYMYDREAMSQDAREFMESLATEEMWETSYESGSYNSIKFISSGIGSKVEQAGVVSILKWTLYASAKSPKAAWNAFVNLTKMVWDIDSGTRWSINAGIANNEFNIAYRGNPYLQKIFGTYTLVCNVLLPHLFNHIGILILILLFMAVGRISKINMPNVLIVLAPTAYNFGTMLLLSGPDFRLFHFNFLIFIPMLYIMLYQKNSRDKEGAL